MKKIFFIISSIIIMSSAIHAITVRASGAHLTRLLYNGSEIAGNEAALIGQTVRSIVISDGRILLMPEDSTIESVPNDILDEISIRLANGTVIKPIDYPLDQ